MVELTDLNLFNNFDLDEEYKKYLPKQILNKKEISLGEDLSVEVPFTDVKENSEITYGLQSPYDYGDEFHTSMFPLHNDYENVNVTILKDNKITLSKDLFPIKGEYVFRIVVKNEKNLPVFNVYRWNISVK